MRNPSRSPELARRVAEEKLPITVTTMDVDSDESVRDNIAAIQKEHGSIDVLVNNAGVERAGSVEELALGEFSRGDGDKLFWRAALHSGRGATYAQTAKRMHHQCELGGWAHYESAVGCLCRVEVGAGSDERSACGRNENVSCACGDCRARHH